MFPSVGLICSLENSRIQMQNILQNDYMLSLIFLFIPLPFLYFLPCMPTATLLSLFQPILLARFKYECIRYFHACFCGQPDAIQASTFHSASGTSLEPDTFPSGTGASTSLWSCSQLWQNYLSQSEKKCKASSIQLLQEKQNLLLLLKGESSHRASHSEI